MKYLILLALLACLSCNHVKKITGKMNERTSFKEVQHKDSLAVNEDITRLQHNYFTDRNRSLLVSFFPKASASLNDSLRIVDSNGLMTIQLGSNAPAALLYTAGESTATAIDSLNQQRDSVVANSTGEVVKKVRVTHKSTDKKSNRVPWYLVAITGLLLLVAAVIFRQMTSIPTLQVSDTGKNN